MLDAMGISYTVDPSIVRGLDYYTRTVFEFVAEGIGAQSTVCGGGRYDKLVEEIGGPSIPAVGFGMGIERVLMLLDSEGVEIPKPDQYDVFVTYMGANKIPAFMLVQELRKAGINADMDHTGRSLKAQFKYANKIGASKVIVVAGDELEKGVVKVRDMNGGGESEVARTDVVKTILEMK